MGKYLAILDRSVEHGTCDKSDISDESSVAVVCAQPPPDFGRLSRFGRTLDVLESRCPEFVPVERWLRAIEDGRRFLAQWAGPAAALGWTAPDLFGLHQAPAKPRPSYNRLSRYDGTGLVWLLGGRPVVALTEATAAILGPTGAVTVYRRHNNGDSLDDLRGNRRCVVEMALLTLEHLASEHLAADQAKASSGIASQAGAPYD
jgi:hypothetical protein